VVVGHTVCSSERGTELMLVSLRATLKPPSLIQPFSSIMMFEGFKSQWMIPRLCKNWRAERRSRPKSCTLDSGRRSSWVSRLRRSPPTQYSSISQRWLPVSYLHGVGVGLPRLLLTPAQVREMTGVVLRVLEIHGPAVVAISKVQVAGSAVLYAVDAGVLQRDSDEAANAAQDARAASASAGIHSGAAKITRSHTTENITHPLPTLGDAGVRSC
jgi:hypothetical protein